MFYISFLSDLKCLGISLCWSGCDFATASWFAMKLFTDDLTSWRFFLLPKTKMKAYVYFQLFFRVFISKFNRFFYRYLIFFNTAPQDKMLTPKLISNSRLWHSWVFHQVWCNFNLSFNSYYPTGIPNNWCLNRHNYAAIIDFFSKHIIFMLFCNDINHLIPKKVENAFAR